MGQFYEGYSVSRQKVLEQSLEDDLRLIDDLFGRDNLRYGATPDEVKQEALRQHEREWTDHEWKHSTAAAYAELFTKIHKAGGWPCL